MKNPLTKATAKLLIQRETGIIPSKLVAPTDMNQNRKYPYYELVSGSLRISLYFSAGDPDRLLIKMDIEYLNSGHKSTSCFFSDTLEYADAHTQYRYWDDLSEIIRDTDPETVCKRYLRDARDENRQHYKAQ